MVIMTPSNERECRQLLSTAFNTEHPTAVRYPRGAGAGIQTLETLDTLPLGQAKIERVCQQESGKKIVVLCFGTLLYPALEMAQKIDVSIVNMRFVKPLDEKLLLQLAAEYDGFVSLEEGVVAGGAGSACLEFLMKSGVCKPFLQLGLPDQFIDHGDPQILMSQCGLDALGIEKSINSYFSWMKSDKSA
jgi:1-deoxy-D-xylulose-5-phosphate synthase